ncbi:MAG: hypothetical protein E7452_04560 [Ruminococcaceae bacterium]|nr:hypothetical protein [Oscillospiraceae bacterium]
MKHFIALLLVLMMSISLCACGEREGSSATVESTKSPINTTVTTNEPVTASSPVSTSGVTTAPNATSAEESTAEESTTVSTRPDIQLSDKIDDFTASIDGLVYQLGCGIDVLLNDEWIPKSGYVLEEDYSVPAGETRGVIVYRANPDNMVTALSYYPGAEASTYQEGILYGFHSEAGSTAEVVLSGGVKLDENTTLRDIVLVFGEDYTYSQFDGNRYVYKLESKGQYIFTFQNDHLVYWEFKLNKDTLG